MSAQENKSVWLRRVACLLIALLSVGWLLPLWTAVDCYLQFWQEPGMDLLTTGKSHFLGWGAGPPLLFMMARESFTRAVVWFGMVAAFWSYLAATRIFGGPAR
jgi:Na+/proline symporter